MTKKLSTTKLALAAQKLWESEGHLRTAEPIAIVGMACRFPGGVRSPEELWKLLLEGADVVGEVPLDRWDVNELYDADPATPGKITTKWGGFLEDIRGFDAAFFDITPMEAERMDPQQRVTLEVAVEAFERAGLRLENLRGSETGVYFSSYTNDYAQLQYEDLNSITARTLTGTLHSVLANRISYILDLRGPNVHVDTACSSSLVSLHLACQALRTRDCDLALAGGVSLMVSPRVIVALSKGGFMSPTGRCRTFDASADGFVRAEGCAVVVVRRLADAIANGDHILGIVRGSAVNQDGETTTLSAPNGVSQEALIRKALHNAGVTPEEVTLVEAHGTGTELGDPIETDALASVYRGRAARHGPLWLGSLKANIGHPEAAAGVAGVMKTVLCMQHRTIPPHRFFTGISPHIDFAGTPIQIASEPTSWTPSGGTRIAGVNSFGVGGTNAHMILEEAPDAIQPPDAEPLPPPFLLPIAARSANALKELAGAYATRIRDGGDPGIIARAAARRRSHHAAFRATALGPDAAEMIAALDRIAAGPNPRRIADRHDCCFVFTGQGAQWAGMGAALMEQDPAFAGTMERLDRLFAEAGELRLLEELQRPAEASRLDRTDVAQAGIFAVQLGLLRLLEHWGIRPTIVVGHSVGELAAAVAAGLLEEGEAVRAVLDRGAAMQGTYDLGRMISVQLAPDAARAFMGRHGLRLAIAAENAPGTVVLSGATLEVEAAVAALGREGTKHTRLDVRFAFHSPLMAEAAGALRGLGRSVGRRAARLPFVSTVTGEPLEQFDYEYLARNVESPVRFAAAIAYAIRSGVRHFVEIGPHPTLGGPVTEVGQSANVEVGVTYTLHRQRPPRATLLATVGKVYEWGLDPDWANVLAGEPGSPDLPTYPWQHVSYWLPERARSDQRAPAQASRFPGRRLSSPALRETVFELSLDDAVFAAFEHHRIAGRVLVPGTAFAELFRSAGEASGVRGAVVRDLGILRPIEMGVPGSIQVVLTPRDNGEAHAELFLSTTDSDWDLAASAEIVPADASQREARVPLVHGLDTMEPSQPLYDYLAGLGNDFGPDFRLLDRLRVDARDAEGALAPQRASSWTGPAHPALVDAGAQLGVAILRNGGSNGRGAFMQWSIDRYAVKGSTSAATRARATLRESSGDVVVLDVALTDDAGNDLVQLQGLRLRRGAAADAPLYVRRWTASAIAERRSGTGTWLVLEDASGLAERVATGLRHAGRKVIRVGPEALAAEVDEALTRLAQDPAWEGVISTRAVDAIPLEGRDAPAVSAEASSRPLLILAGAVARRSREGLRVLVVTRGAQSVGDVGGASSVGDATALGMARGLRAEFPEVACTALDLEGFAGAEGSWDSSAEAVIDEALAGKSDGEVAVRRGVRMVAAAAPAHLDLAPARVAGPVSLVHRSPGSLDGFALQPAREQESVEPGQVMVRVQAAGLNFRDLLVALGGFSVAAHLADAASGHEAYGEVVRIGDDVTSCAPGDRVLVHAPGCFASFVVASESRVIPAPPGLDPVACATLPIAFGTAWYAIRELADIGPGDRVLVHAGAGGVGMASLGIARALGATVYATAGSPEKRALLLRMGAAGAFDSRSPSFEADVMAATGGEGVHLVVNSLVGPMIPAGLRCLRPGGVFAELGKRELLRPEQVEAVRQDIRYCPFDFTERVDADPSLFRRTFDDVGAMLARGELAPLPAVSMPLRDAQKAFRRMGRAEHVGKLVLLPPTLTQRLEEPGWFVITGGSGGLGMAALDWLVSNGARRIALWSRSAPRSEVLHEIARHRQAGAEIRIDGVDVADSARVEEALAALRAEGSTIRGVLHTAGIVDDGLLPNLTWARIAAVLRAKVTGAWNLHRATLDDPIDVFFLYSSAGPVLDGNAAGQASYAAANAFLDALAAHRRGRGLAAVSLQWGPWSGVGMAARLSEASAQRWAKFGLDWWNAQTGGTVLQNALGDVRPVLVSIRLTRAVRKDAAGPVPTRDAVALPARLAALPAAQRLEAAVGHVVSCVNRVFGTPDPIDPNVRLRDLGLDSLSAMELRNALTMDMGSSMPAALAFDYPTPTAIGRFLLERLGLADGDGAAPSPVAATAELPRLSDEEAEALLVQQWMDAEPGPQDR